MDFRFDFKGWHFHIGLNHSRQVEGVNSELPDGKHFLMWDFDDVKEEDVKDSLVDIQKHFRLPRIWLINTGIETYWHAYCFKALAWPDMLKILASTQYLDKVFFKIGVIRGYFTLRYTDKSRRDFKPAVILKSRYKEDVNPFELTNMVKYWTKRL